MDQIKRIFKCPWCNHEELQEMHMKSHIHWCHGPLPSDAEFALLKGSNSPQQMWIDQEGIKVYSRKFFECRKCSKQFKLMIMAKRHIESAHLDVKYICELCKFTTLMKSRMKLHLRRDHGQKFKNFDDLAIVRKIARNGDKTVNEILADMMRKASMSKNENEDVDMDVPLNGINDGDKNRNESTNNPLKVRI